MKTKTILIVFILLLLAGCGPSFLEAINTIETSDDSKYGYKTSDAILIGYFEPTQSIQATYLFLSSLRTSTGKKFTYTRTGSYADDSFKRSMLDGYLLVDEEKRDTVILFFDIYNKGKLKVPRGMKWETLQ